ncbi:MAG: galactose oxidase-like domain-containing protein [Geminicoccaceae bacterium]
MSAAEGPELTGRWSAIYRWPDVAIHLHLLPSGNPARARLLSFSDDDVTGLKSRNAGFSKSYLVDIPTGSAPATTWAYVPNNVTNLFCAGHTFLPDGRLLAMGGHINANYYGSGDINLFSEQPAPAWQTQPNAMNAGRWYPSVISLPNREVLVVSGTTAGTTDINPLPQVWKTDAGGGLRDLTGARLKLKTYPKLFVLPDGRVVSVATEKLTRYLDTSGAGKWTSGPKRVFGNRVYACAVLYGDGKVLVAGGATTNSTAPTATAEVIDFTAPKPAWRAIDAMAFARKHANSTILPDGTVLVTGGSRSSAFNDAAGAILAAELWDPATEGWTRMASAQVPRIYHSTALLLPDGRVLSAGGGRPKAKNGGANNSNCEIFEPPYLFKGTRPEVTQAPATAALGQQIEVTTPDAASIAQVTLVRLGSVTHTFNMNQRFNRLSFTSGSGKLSVSLPSDPKRLLPGHYLLFALNGQGVPSVGRVIGIATD